MDPKPLLIFPSPIREGRTKRKLFPPQFNIPDKNKQVGKFQGTLTNLSTVLKNQTAQLFSSISGLAPEMVLVFEIAGTIDEFFKAVEKTQGMEFLSQYKNEFAPDADFYYADDPSKLIESRIFLTMSNQQGLTELLTYWRAWESGRDIKRGAGQFKHLFSQLRDLRPYNVSDRFRDTGFEKYYKEQLEIGTPDINFEIELVYSSSSVKRERIISDLKTIIANNNGSVIIGSESVISEISYHGIIGKAPLSAFSDLTENASVNFLKFPWILYFRPVGQTVSKPQIDTTLAYPAFSGSKPLPTISEPSIALLDGLPLANHQILADRIVIDDPDNFTSHYQAKNRIHGTSMASLIIHGDLGDNEEPLNRRIYVRPVMVPYPALYDFEERMPEDKLPIDLIHRAIRRIMDSPALKTIRIINLSICDPYQPYLNSVSTFAKLLDWLAYKYDLLFIVSAGNYNENLELEIASSTYNSLTPDQKQTEILKALLHAQSNRKILSPAESVNSLSIGAIYDDASTITNLGNRHEPYIDRVLPSTYSRVGYGINKSLKPDIFIKGGRLLYRIAQAVSSGNKTELAIAGNTLQVPPGNIIAVPGSTASLNSTGFSSGTSNSTALVTRQAARLYEVLETINSDNGSTIIPSAFFPVLIKSLLTHYSSTSDSWDTLERELNSFTTIPEQVRKSFMYQTLSYGTINLLLLGFCTDYRVTLIGFGELNKDDAHIYTFPLPNAISGSAIEKNLTVTLSWFSPINFNSGKYRQAALFFDNIQGSDDLDLERVGSGFNYTKRGTLQHDILKGTHADAYIDNSELSIKVNCREFASGLKKQPTKYALAVTLEIDQRHGIPIYEEIRTRISQHIQIVS